VLSEKDEFDLTALMVDPGDEAVGSFVLALAKMVLPSHEELGRIVADLDDAFTTEMHDGARIPIG